MEENNQTCSESEANVTVQGNLVSETNVANSDVVSNVDSNVNTNVNPNVDQSNISAAQLQDILATVMKAIQDEGNRQVAALEAKLSAESYKQFAGLTSAVENLKNE
jgi:hypothetical protein